MNTATVTVRYTCNACGLREREVVVPARESPDIDVCEWVRMVGSVCGADHAEFAPDCRSGKVDLKFPLPHAGEWIGQPVRQ